MKTTLFLLKNNRREFYSDLGRTTNTLCYHNELVEKGAEYFNKVILRCMKLYPVRPITADNGKQFSSLSEIEGLDVYFVPTYSDYEQNTNENFNRLYKSYQL